MGEINKAFIVGIHRYCYKAGEVAEITNMVWVSDRLCYEAKYLDDSIDFIPVIDEANYIIISELDVKEGNIPKVIN